MLAEGRRDEIPHGSYSCWSIKGVDWSVLDCCMDGNLRRGRTLRHPHGRMERRASVRNFAAARSSTRRKQSCERVCWLTGVCSCVVHGKSFGGAWRSVVCIGATMFRCFGLDVGQGHPAAVVGNDWFSAVVYVFRHLCSLVPVWTIDSCGRVVARCGSRWSTRVSFVPAFVPNCR